MEEGRSDDEKGVYVSRNLRSVFHVDYVVCKCCRGDVCRLFLKAWYGYLIRNTNHVLHALAFRRLSLHSRGHGALTIPLGWIADGHIAVLPHLAKARCGGIGQDVR